jgi:hypothetical protein
MTAEDVKQRFNARLAGHFGIESTDVQAALYMAANMLLLMSGTVLEELATPEMMQRFRRHEAVATWGQVVAQLADDLGAVMRDTGQGVTEAMPVRSTLMAPGSMLRELFELGNKAGGAIFLGRVGGDRGAAGGN